VATRHSWTDEDEQVLLEAVECLVDLRETFGKKADWWSAVAGWMASRDIAVSGEACRKRLSLIRERDPEMHEDGWSVATALCFEHEADAWDRVEERLGRIEAMLGVTLLELGIEWRETVSAE